MGIPSNDNNLFLVEFEIKADSLADSHLICNLPEDTHLSIIIQNEVGSINYKNRFQLKAGNNKVSLDLSKLNSGKYHAWIDILGQTILKELIIERHEKKADHWLKKVRNIFSTL